MLPMNDIKQGKDVSNATSDRLSTHGGWLQPSDLVSRIIMSPVNSCSMSWLIQEPIVPSDPEMTFCSTRLASQSQRDFSRR